jgi:hypothetical protein
MDVLWHPDATRKPLPADMGGTLARSAGLVLHVQAGDNSPWGWFGRADVKASSHWWVAKTGALEQYVPADRIAWAQAGGNGAWHSAETEGFPGEGLTVAQIATLGRLYRWGHERWSWALHLAESPGGTGLGWHGMGGTAWGSHPGCPGDLRKGQRSAILAAAVGGQSTFEPPEEPMPTPQEYARAVLNELRADMWERPTDAAPDWHPPFQRHAGAVLRKSYEFGGDAIARLGRIERGLAAATPVAARAMAEAPHHLGPDELSQQAGMVNDVGVAVRVAHAYLERAMALTQLAAETAQ